MDCFRKEHHMPVPPVTWQEARKLFHGFTLGDDATLAEIQSLHRSTGYLADPHTAIGIAAARAVAPQDPRIPVIIAATAHPAKFPDVVERAVGIRPPLPPRFADLYAREERYTVLPDDLALIENAVRAHAYRNAS